MATSSSSQTRSASVFSPAVLFRVYRDLSLHGISEVWAGRRIHWEILLVGTTTFGGLMVLHHLIGMSGDLMHAGVVAGAAGGMYAYLRRVMSLPAWTALIGAALFMLHPLIVARTTPTTSTGSNLPMLMAPLLLLVCRQCLSAKRLGAAIGWVGLFGGGLALCAPTRGLLVVLAVLCPAVESILSVRGPTIYENAKRLIWVIAIAVFIVLGTSKLTARLDLFRTEPAIASVPTGITAPHAWVDRDGVLARRLNELPEDLTAGEGAHYLGGGVVLLCLIALWPSKRNNRTRRAAGLITLALILAWLTLEQDLHAQLQHLFEFATVRRHIEPATLHLLGLMTLALLGLVLLVFLAVAELVNTKKTRRTFPTVFLASMAVMLWWGIAPLQGSSSITSMLGLDRSMDLLESFVACLLICGATVGLYRMSSSADHLRFRLLVSVIFLTLFVVDVYPYVNKTWNLRGNESLQTTPTIEPSLP